MLKRAKSPFVGLWSFPGGHVEQGEEIKSTLEREVFEEVGLRLPCERIAASWNEVLVKSDGTKKHFVMFVGLFTAEGTAELKPSSEGTLQWFMADEFMKVRPNAVPSDWAVAKSLSFRKSRKAMRHFEVEIKEKAGHYELKRFHELV